MATSNLITKKPATYNIHLAPPYPCRGNPKGAESQMGTRTRAAVVCTPALWALQSRPPDVSLSIARDDGGECTCWRPPRTRAPGSKKNKSQPERSDLRKKCKGKPIKSKPNVIKTYKMPVPVPRRPYPCLYPFRGRLN